MGDLLHSGVAHGLINYAQAQNKLTQGAPGDPTSNGLGMLGGLFGAKRDKQQQIGNNLLHEQNQALLNQDWGRYADLGSQITSQFNKMTG